MPLVLSITFVIKIYGVACVQLTHFSSSDWKVIFIAPMLLSSSNRKYQPFQLLSYFSVVVCLRCSLHHIMSRIAYTFLENWDFVLIIIVQFMMSANSRMRYGLQIVFFVRYYNHCANLSVDISLWNVCQIYILSSLYVFSLPNFHRDGWENILLCLIIIIKSEVWAVIYCLWLGHETMVCAVCLFMFLIVGEDVNYIITMIYMSSANSHNREIADMPKALLSSSVKNISDCIPDIRRSCDRFCPR